MKGSLATAALLVGCAAAAFCGTASGNHDVSLTLNTIAAIRIYPTTGSVTLTIVEPAVAGGIPADVTDTSRYLQYTVVSSAAYRVTVSASGTVPTGTVLTVVASSPATGGGTSRGSSTGSVPLTSGMSATTVLDTIQNCYTGNGATDGSNLTYTYGVGGSFGDEVPGSGTLTVTYTLVSP